MRADPINMYQFSFTIGFTDKEIGFDTLNNKISVKWEMTLKHVTQTTVCVTCFNINIL